MGLKNKSIESIRKDVAALSPSVTVSLDRGCVRLTGEVEDWATVIAVGQAAASKNHLGVLNDVKLKGFCDTIQTPCVQDKTIDGKKPDVLVVGGGIVGCAIARELARYNMSVLLVEKGYDVALGASSRNDGCVHVGIDLHAGQQKLHYNGIGNAMYGKLCDDLGVHFERKGHVIIFYKKWERLLGLGFQIRAKQNKIAGVRYCTREELKKLEPGIPSWTSGGIFMPSGGIVSPYKLTIALAENAATNGVEFSFDTIVKGMEVKDDNVVSVQTNRGTVYPKIVVNAAGVFADVIAEMAGDRTFTIHPRKGTNLILDKKTSHYSQTSMTKSPFSVVPNAAEDLSRSNLVNVLNAAMSKSHTKGGGVVRTADGNVLVGPTAIEQPKREDYSTEKKDVDAIFAKQKITAYEMTYGDIITYFSGTRASTYEEDFVVRKGVFTKNVLEAAGIQSPGITAAPAIGVQIAEWANELLGNVGKNPDFVERRKPIPHLAELDDGARDALIKQNPDYGFIVCRCEEVSKGEIIDALRSPLAPPTVDAVKRRVRPGMGRCQGGFCSPLVAKIISEEKGIPLTEVKKAGDSSELLLGDTK